jgi:hypothetical protein
VARTTAVLVLTAGVRLHHHWSSHRSVVAVGRCRIWRRQCRREFLPHVVQILQHRMVNDYNIIQSSNITTPHGQRLQHNTKFQYLVILRFDNEGP